MAKNAVSYLKQHHSLAAQRDKEIFRDVEEEEGNVKGQGFKSF